MSERTKREKRIRRISLIVVFAMVITLGLGALAGGLHYTGH